ncbi:DUF4231 domain-containing protein [Rhizobium leguminosarum]|uniref:DUF4231 domain-containing protein n=1 Tax=Rhizobium leguminosarum TaxID=384 RepID=UPI00103F17B2|nr:DUF4231 domain-containing protein [Rhizobium leguminosarum]MBY5503441.1 DUF4231 domain-containing protein [Rhizobium leguminosarum]TBZ68803.1 DUF4231 domain-containing protein [Rhizobium leguminosarum bv. viciae]
MAFFRKDNTVSENAYHTAEEFYAEVRGGLREKSNSNKVESELMFFCIIGFTLLSPLFVTLADGFWLGKVTPAVLSVLAAAATAWLQLRKPQRLWSLYRRAQRELEREKSYYDFKIGPYADAINPEQLLAGKIADIAFGVHEQWEGLVPEPDMLVSLKVRSLPDGHHESPKPANS